MSRRPKREYSVLEIALGDAVARVPEKAVEHACDRIAERLAATVVRFSQARETRQTLGIPDRRYRHRGDAIWFEVKPPDGLLYRHQYTFLVAEAECGAIVGCGGEHELAILFGTPRAERWRVGLEQVQAWAAKGFKRERKDGTPSRPPPPRAPKGPRVQLVRRRAS